MEGEGEIVRVVMRQSEGVWRTVCEYVLGWFAVHIRCTSDAHRMHIGYTSDVHRMHIGCASNTHWMCIGCTSDTC